MLPCLQSKSVTMSSVSSVWKYIVGSEKPPDCSTDDSHLIYVFWDVVARRLFF